MKKQLRLLAFLLTVCSLSYAWWIQTDGQVLESLNSTFSGTDVPLEETVEENIRLATFNIQVFGVKKLEKQSVQQQIVTNAAYTIFYRKKNWHEENKKCDPAKLFNQKHFAVGPD